MCEVLSIFFNRLKVSKKNPGQALKSKAGLRWRLLHWNEHQEEERTLVYPNVHFCHKISHFESVQLHRGIPKETALPYEERREHSWKKNDCCTAWTNVILALLLIQLSAQMRAGDACGLRSSVRPSASCLWMLHRPKSSRTFLPTQMFLFLSKIQHTPCLWSMESCM